MRQERIVELKDKSACGICIFSDHFVPTRINNRGKNRGVDRGAKFGTPRLSIF
jgi:hypothetical protein